MNNYLNVDAPEQLIIPEATSRLQQLNIITNGIIWGIFPHIKMLDDDDEKAQKILC